MIPLVKKYDWDNEDELRKNNNKNLLIKEKK